MPFGTVPPPPPPKLSALEIDVDKDWLGFKIKNVGAPLDSGDAARLADLLLSKLAIDVDKDWGGKLIKNLGAPVDAGDAARKGDLDSHKTASPIDHPDASVTRAKLEYPTVDVSFAYLASIEKLILHGLRWNAGAVTADDFTDKRVWSIGRVGADYYDGILVARFTDGANNYHVAWNSGWATADHKIRKIVSNTITDLAAEAVDLTGHHVFHVAFQCAGSTLKSWRTDSIPDWTAPTLSATDTSFSSGKYGVCFGGDIVNARLLAPASPLPPAQAIIELGIEGSGKLEDPYRPSLSKSPTPDGKDLDSVTWGAFELHPDKAPTAIVTITGDNPYKAGAIDRQKAKAKRAFTPPKSYDEAVSLYNQLKKDYPHWLAGRDNFAYQVLGLEVFDWTQNIDFYYGELIEHKTHCQQLKAVPDFEIRNRLNELIEKLSKVSILAEERDKHINKAREVLRAGW
jgi:hypothetical protein